MARAVQDKEIKKAELRRWLNEFLDGSRTKNDIERDELMDPKSHGKRISRLWREVLGVETEHEHPAVTENRRLRALLEEHGIDPEEG